MLVGALLACSVGLVPGQSMKMLGGEISAIGLLMSVAPVVIQVRSFHVVKKQPTSWWLWRAIVAQCASLPFLIGAACLVFSDSNGRYWVAAGVLVTLAATVWNSWILLIEILR